MAKLAKQNPEPPTAPVVATLYVQQPATNSGYTEYTRCAALLPDAAALFTESVLYTGKPQGEYIGQCARMLVSPQVGYSRRFHSGLRYIGIGPGGQCCYVGDCKRNYKDPNETGRTLIAVFSEPAHGHPGCLLLFVTARSYSRKRPTTNTAFAQRFFRECVRPRLAGWLQAVPAATALFQAEYD